MKELFGFTGYLITLCCLGMFSSNRSHREKGIWLLFHLSACIWASLVLFLRSPL